MVERPILFSAPMVRALLAGTKTQTRRLVKPQFQRAPVDVVNGVPSWDAPTNYGGEVQMNTTYGKPCRYGAPGDRLWVRETWGVGTRPCPREGWYDGIEFRADEVYLDENEYLHLYRVKVPEGKDLEDYRGGWKPSIHMPRWACRILLEVTDVRVERLQSISEEDARAEGITDGGCTECGCSEPCGCANPSPAPRESYAHLWQEINGPGSWDANPWVWVVEFRMVQPC